MKRYLLLASILIYTTLPSIGQKTFKLTVEQELHEDLLLLKFFVQKSAGEDFALGTSNIAVTLNSADLDLSKKFKIDTLSSPFDGSSDPDSYYPLTLGGDKIVNLTVVVNSGGKGLGKKITEQKMLLAGVGIPIKNKCGIGNVNWIKDKVAICIYSKKAKPTNVKDKANFIDPEQIALSRSLDIPVIAQDIQRKLFIDFEGSKQWYLNDDSIAGATSNDLIPYASGKYKVKVYDGCGQSYFTKEYQMLITSYPKYISENELTIEFYPNPFIDNLNLKINNVNSGKVLVKLFDAIGNTVFHKEYISSSGVFDTNISTFQYHLAPGYYFAEIISEHKVKTLRLIKLNS